MLSLQSAGTAFGSDPYLIYSTPQANREEIEGKIKLNKVVKQLSKQRDDMVRPVLKSLETLKETGSVPTDMNPSAYNAPAPRKADTPAQRSTKDLLNREIRKSNEKVIGLNRRYNPIVLKLQQAWQEHGKGLKYIQVGVTMLPGRKLRLETIRLSDDSNVKPNAAKLVIACVQETLASVEGDKSIDTGLAGESSAGICFGLTSGEIHPYDMKLLPEE